MMVVAALVVGIVLALVITMIMRSSMLRVQSRSRRIIIWVIYLI